MNLENRQDRLEDRFGELEHRQYSFEKSIAESIAESKKDMAEFKAEIRMYMKNNDATIARLDERMNRVEDKMDKLSSQMQNLTTATAVGVAAIVIAVVLSR